MIFAETERRCEQLLLQPWDAAFDFLGGLSADTDDGRYVIDGDAMYAVIESYTTRHPHHAQPEAHQTYIDIQVLLSGHEKIACWPTSELQIATPYVPEKDITFYQQPQTAASTIVLAPGRFAIFFPNDAHMPGLQSDTGAAPVKKVVIKIRRDTLT